MEVFSFLKPSHKIRWLVGAWLWEHCPNAPLLLLIFWVGAGLKENISEAAGGGNRSRAAQFLWIFQTAPSLPSSPKMAPPFRVHILQTPSGESPEVSGCENQNTLLGCAGVWPLSRAVLSSTTARKLPFLPDRAASDESVWGEERGKWARKEAGGSFRLRRSVFHFWAHSARLNVAQDGWRGKWRGGTRAGAELRRTRPLCSCGRRHENGSSGSGRPAEGEARDPACRWLRGFQPCVLEN